ncbi:MAG: hypothetical protein KI786_10705 [Mameliella sp.]|nr:hypothetical protein [Phaeodactylibacter sp.]
MYLTSDIWTGVYSSHQRCLEALQRLGITPRQPQSAISESEYLRLLEYRLKTANGEKQAEVEHRIACLTQDGTALNAATATSEPVQPTPPRLIRGIQFLAHWATSEAIVFCTLVGAIAIQVHHVAQLVHRISEADNLWLGYVFGSVSEITALMLTVHQARRSMLIVFAVVQCWINILYYCELPDLTIKITLSGLIAFVIYAYSDLFAVLKTQKAT